MNKVQLQVDTMLSQLPKGFDPKRIRTSYAFKKYLGKEHRGITISYSILCTENSIYIE